MLLERKPELRYHLLAALILTFIMRMSLPLVRYVYYPLFILLVVDFLVSKPDGPTVKRIVRHLAPYLLLVSIFLAASLYHTAFLRPYIEILNALELAAILIIIFYYTTGRLQWSSFRAAFIRQLLVLTVITALVGLGRLTFAAMGGDLPLEEGESLVSTASDYNFFVLALLYGMILVIYKLLSSINPGNGRILLYNASLVVLFAGIVLVPSRRGAVILLLFLLSLTIFRFIALFYRPSVMIARMRRMDYFLALVLVSMVGLNIFLFHTSHQFKEDLLIRTGLYRMDLRSRLTDAWFRYSRMVDRDAQFREAYVHLWGKGSNHGEDRILIDQSFTDDKGEFRKKGNSRIRIVSTPQGPGCLAMRAAKPDQGVSGEFYADVGDTIEVTARVRVIQWDRHLGLAIPDRDNRKPLYAKALKEWEGDGQWHELRIRVVYDVFGNLPVWFGGGSSPDSSSLSCWSGIQVIKGHTGHMSANQLKSPSTSQKDWIVPDFPDARIARLIPPMSDYSGHAGKDIDSESTANGKQTNSQEGYWFLPNAASNALLQKYPNNRTLDSLVSKMKGPFPDNRPGRWKLAGQIFRHYSLSEKLIGNGFSWLPLYGRIFYENPRYYDYPHNPIISTVLYSGLMGGLIYLAYLTWSLILYLNYRRQHALFLVLFLLTGVFVSVSGNSHFSIPVFAFLTQLPFFFSYIDKNKISSPE